MVTLPEELLQHIFLFLSISADFHKYPEDKVRLQTLRNISLASKSFNRLARPPLYHTLDLKIRGLFRVRHLLRAIINHPGTGDLVRELHVEGWTTQVDVDNGNATLDPAPAELLQQYLQVVDRLSLSPNVRRRLGEGLRKGLEDAEIALLLCLCSKIQLLEMQVAYLFQNTIVGDVVRDAAASGRAEESQPNEDSLPMPCLLLSEISLSHWDTENATEISDLTAFLQLPKLQTFKGFAVSCEADSDLSSLQSQMRKCLLDFSLMDARGMASLLAAAPMLEILSMTWGSSTVGASEVSYAGIGQVLRRYGSKLTTLRLNSEDELEEFLDDTALGDLSELTSLEVLDVPFLALFGNSDDDEDNDSENDEDTANNDTELAAEKHEDYLAKTLPKSLKTLRVLKANNDENVELRDSQLRALMEDKGFTKLNAIRVNRSDPFSQDLTECTWDDSESNQFWLILKRQL